MSKIQCPYCNNIFTDQNNRYIECPDCCKSFHFKMAICEPEPVDQSNNVNTTVPTADEFTKFDDDKIMYDLVDPDFMYNLAAVLTHGAKKYSPDNWKKVEDLATYRSALMRHFEAYRTGEHTDPDSGFSHLAHVACNVMFLYCLEAEREMNDT